MRDLWRRSGVGRPSLERLAAADAFRSLGLDRRQALWEIRGLPRDVTLPLFDHARSAESGAEDAVALPVMPLSEHVVNDYRTLRLSLKAHPMSFLRTHVAAARISSCADLKTCRDGARLSVAGLVLVRQRPGSAQGVVFMTLEDETGVANTIVWPDVFARYRQTVLKASLLMVEGRLQREQTVIHLVAQRLTDMTDRLHALAQPDAPLEPPFARADEVKRPGRDHRDLPAGPDPLYPSRNFH